MSRLSRFGVLLCLAPLAGAAPTPEMLARLPLRFEANQGQAPANVRYTARAGAYTLQLTEGGPAVYLGARRIDISLPGANRAPRIDALDPLRTRTSYFVGPRDRWRPDVPSFARVKYASVYPGVDMIYYGNQSQLEYDFVVAPGADPNAIRMSFRGAKSVRIGAAGDLLVDDMIQKRPVIYQDNPRREVTGRYVLLGRNTVGVRVGRYDRSRELVIDPVLAYSTYMGGTATDRINASKLMGNKLYVTGQTTNADLGSTDGAYSTAPTGSIDIFIAVLDATPGGGFPLLYMSYFGGTGDDIPLAIDVDSSNFIYLTGTTTSTDFPLAGNGFQATAGATGTSSYLVKFNPNYAGTDALWYATYLSGTTAETTGNGIAVGPDGATYIVGTTQASDFPVTPNAYQSVLWGAQDTFVVKVAADGTLAYASYLGGEGVDDGRAILLGPDGLVYIAATTGSDYFPMAGYSAQPFRGGAQDAVLDVMDLTKDGAASLVYGTFYGGSGIEEVRGMAFDAKGNVLITGYTLSTDLPVTTDAMQGTAAGNGDAFVAVLNPSLPFARGLVYSTYFGGTHTDVGYKIAGDAQGDIVVSGYTLSPDLPVTASAPQMNWGGGTDLFVTKFKTGIVGKGALQYSTYLGKTSTYLPTGVSIASDGSAVVVGYAGAGFPLTPNARQGAFFGGTDGFICVIQ
jgi:hypothetical protein